MTTPSDESMKSKENFRKFIKNNFGKQGFSKNVYGHACNVGNKKDREKMIQDIKEKHNGRLDVLVSNVASSTHFGNQLDINEK